MRQHRGRLTVGGVLLFFVLASMPLMFLSGSLTVDFSRVVLAQRQAAQLADSAATAGAFQTVTKTTSGVGVNVDGPAAIAAANETVKRAMAAGAGSQVLLVGVPKVTVTPASGTKAATVTVTVTYDVRGLMFLGLLDRGGAGRTTARGTVTRTAFVCEPGYAPTYGGSCSRPRGF